MAVSIASLPFELLSNILEEAARQNLPLLPTYTYGLSQAPEPGREARLQRVVRGNTSPDALRWEAVEGICQVNRTWHDWALGYALKSLYISRWRGSERWLQSRNLHQLRSSPSTIAVYRDPYLSLRKTADLLSRYPSSAFYVRRLWFNGYYSLETNALIFDILLRCTKLDHLTVPWTTLRYDNEDQWSQVLRRRSDRRKPLSLEFLAVDLSGQKLSDSRSRIDDQPMDLNRLDFGGVERLKIFGSSNFMPVTDGDLAAIARTATKLREIHVTGTSTVSIDGVMALAVASRADLRVLEHSPLAKDGFEHPKATSAQHHGHLCSRLLECRRLQNLSVSMPTLCEQLFSDAAVRWTGEVQIRAESLCHHPDDGTKARKRFWNILDHARSLMESRNQQEDVDLDIQIFINYWIFEPGRSIVHGNIQFGRALSDNMWPSTSTMSSKGPYGQTGLYGKDEGPYSCISEEDFAEGLQCGYVSL